jgi:hypothetical protein
MILPKVRDPRFVTIRRGGTLSLMRITVSPLYGLPRVQSTSLASSSRPSLGTRDRARRSSMLESGCVARSRCCMLARGAAMRWGQPESCVGQRGMH